MKHSQSHSLPFLIVVLLIASAASAQTFSVLYNFSPLTGPVTPGTPGIIAQGRNGNLYSTAWGGIGNGGFPCYGRCGSVFEIIPPNTMQLKYTFMGNTGGDDPLGGLSLGSDGNFYGATYYGGSSGWGMIYSITPGGVVTDLHDFDGKSSGALTPQASPIQAADFSYYGTTSAGLFYRIKNGVFSTLYIFDGLHGQGLNAPLVQGTDGNLYGVATTGGSGNFGTVFRLTLTGTPTVLYNFSSNVNGATPTGPLTQGTDGFFYGTTQKGGGTTACTGGCGTIFKISTGGKLTTLHQFTGGSDGQHPLGGLVQGSDGNFYGTTSGNGTSSSCGTIFRMTPSGTFTVMHTFANSDGCTPGDTLIQHTSGVLYGETTGGGSGSSGYGVFYSLNANSPPFVSMIFPTGKVGSTVEILGQGFSGTSVVSFNGVGTAFKVISDTYLTATVPTGATTGLLSVVSPSGTLKSKVVFRVKPQITTFSPLSGPVGTQVTISGLSLTQTSSVKIGGVAANFVANSDAQVTATVPTAAISGKIAITTKGGSVTSTQSFTVTQ